MRSVPVSPTRCRSITTACCKSRSTTAHDINAHTKTNQILWHHADVTKPDERIDMADEPDHDALCEREQRYLLEAIDGDLDLTDHMSDAVKSLQIVLAADQSIRTGTVVTL